MSINSITIPPNLPLREQLERQVAAFKSLGGGGWKLADFVLEHGRAFTPDERTFAGKRMAAKQCFANATQLAMRDGDLIYCEGFVDTGFMPIQHGWLCRRDGSVVEPTLDETALTGEKRKIEYFGIPFDRDWLMGFLCRHACYGVLDGMSEVSLDLILGKVPAEKFLAKLNEAA